ncbi:hypothetical protein CBR_g48908 [Chara braunii]|uniref:Reverse transcriptase domain-containing protein n=1 Tax=Chara braunii TaxID=69332 RepID=A0A388M3N8_CHABU|nr:hypothetical protein CBR_g48908 [Chara braunii]|eukprot:GBG89200.1 hypothetical protein CBR_g48908 [Chara braunii]
MTALFTEAKKRADEVAAAEKKKAEDAEEARLLAIEQQRQQDEATTMAADEERIQRREEIFSGERFLLTMATDWRAEAENGKMEESESKIALLLSHFTDILATCIAQQEDIYSLDDALAQLNSRLQQLEQRPVAAPDASSSNTSGRLNALEIDVGALKNDTQLQQTATQQLEQRICAVAANPSLAPRETTPRFDDQEIFCDSTKTDPIPWFRKFELKLQLHHRSPRDSGLHVERQRQIGKLSTAGSKSTTLSTPSEPVASRVTALRSEAHAEADSPLLYSYEDYAAQLVPTLGTHAQGQDVCAASSPFGSGNLSSSSGSSRDSAREFNIEVLDMLTSEDFAWLPLPTTGPLSGPQCATLCAHLHTYLSFYAPPTSPTEDEVAVGDILAYVTKVAREFRKQWYDDNNAPLLYATLCWIATRLISIRPNDRYKSAFKTRYGHFEWVVIPFGLTNAPTTFQATMTNEFRTMLDRFVLVYLYDILVYSRILEDHLEHLRRVLAMLRRAKYKANCDKCELVRQELEYLGHFVTPEGISPLLDKIQAIQEWPELRNVMDVGSFLGLAGYYQCFIKGYSKIATHLTKLQCEDWPFDFGEDARESFLDLKATLLSAEVLRIYDPLLPTSVTTDASGYGIGAVLEQHDGVD